MKNIRIEIHHRCEKNIRYPILYQIKDNMMASLYIKADLELWTVCFDRMESPFSFTKRNIKIFNLK